MTDIETQLRRELHSQWVPYDPSRAEQMIDEATAGVLLGERHWGAPLAAAAAVLALSGGVAAVAAGSSSHHREVPGGGAVSPVPSSSVPAAPTVAPTKPRHPSRSIAPTRVGPPPSARPSSAPVGKPSRVQPSKPLPTVPPSRGAKYPPPPPQRSVAPTAYPSATKPAPSVTPPGVTRSPTRSIPPTKSH